MPCSKNFLLTYDIYQIGRDLPYLVQQTHKSRLGTFKQKRWPKTYILGRFLNLSICNVHTYPITYDGQQAQGGY